MFGRAVFSNSQFSPTNKMEAPLEVAHTVCDELIISDVTPVIKIGHLLRSSSVYSHWGLYASLPVSLLAVLARSWAEDKPNIMACLSRWFLRLFAPARASITHAYISTTGGRASDGASDVISSHSLAHWQNVKADSGATRWKGQWTRFERV